MTISLSKFLHLCLAVIMVVQLSGCGTILHPERKGQKTGNIDVGIAILDGIGLLFFLIPGIIAYAVDFSNGTIYLPASESVSSGSRSFRVVKYDPKSTSVSGIEKIIKDETGYEVSLADEKAQVSKLKSTDELTVRFAQVETERTRLTLLK